MALDFERLLLTEADLAALPKAATVLDERRSRTLFFDGLFLTAAALNREQSYFLTRQGDLALAAGFGVIEGLEVRRVPGSSSRLEIAAGHGLTPSGAAVVLPQDLTVDLAEVPAQQVLNQRLGLAAEPTPPIETRTGLFVLALRPLEFTSNPVAAYPTSLDQNERRLEDSVINEAVLVTLVPFALAGSLADPTLRRAAAAAEIFAGTGDLELPPAALPLAMVELAGNGLVWVDPYLARRDAAVGHSDILGLGLAPQPRRAAHFRQYEAMLDEVVAERQAAGRGVGFRADEHFFSLPAAGRLPAACIAMIDDPVTGERVLSHNFLPPAMPVSLSVVPEDELPALIEESLLLPPIELAAPEAVLENSPVAIYVPLPRTTFESTLRDLQAQTRPLPPRHRFRHLPQKPVDLLRALAEPRVPAPIAPGPVALADSAWAELLILRSFLWFARARQIAARLDLVGEIRRELAGPQPEPEPEPQPEPEPEPEPTPEAGDPNIDLDAGEVRVRDRLRELGLEDRLIALRGASIDLPARQALHAVLGMVIDRDNELMIRGAVAELGAPEKLDEDTADGIGKRYAAPELVDGLAKLEPRLLDPAGFRRTVHRVLVTALGATPQPVIELVARTARMTIDQAQNLLRQLPAEVPRDFDRPQTAGGLVGRIASLGGQASHAPHDLQAVPAAAKQNAQRRVLLAESRTVPELGDIAVRGSDELTTKLVDAMLELFGTGGVTPDKVRDLVLDLHRSL